MAFCDVSHSANGMADALANQGVDGNETWKKVPSMPH